MEHYIQDLFASNYRRDPNREAIYDCDADVHYTWADMHERALRLASFCTNELGLKKGDRVAFLCHDNVSMVSMFHASLKTGLIIIAYNYRLRSSEIAAMLRQETPSVMLFESECAAKVDELKGMVNDSFATVSIDGKSPADYSLVDVFANEYQPFETVELDPEDTAILVHTGGTTGVPKAAMLSYRNVFMNMVVEMKEFGLCRLDTLYSVMPFFHTGGWNVFLLVGMFVGARVVMGRAFSPDMFYRLMEEENHLTVFMGVEMMFKLIARDPRFEKCDLSKLRYVISGGSPVEKSLMMSFMDRGIRFFNGYGSTESGANNSSISFNSTLDEAKEKYDSIGRPFVFNYYRIVDADGHDVPQGEQGELLTRGGVSFSGYWNNDKATADSVRDGWYHTGDMAYADANGDYYICGRIKHMYISGGENVFPQEIEQVIAGYPGVCECHVMGIPDKDWGEVGKAFLVLAPEAQFDEDAFMLFVKEHLSTIKRPRYVQIVSSIPKTTLGKVDTNLLQELHETV